MNTPLKYTHTTTKSLAEIRKKIPAGAVIDSYLLFSGDLELSLSDYDMFVCAHTNKYGIYAFWLHLIEDSRKR